MSLGFGLWRLTNPSALCLSGGFSGGGAGLIIDYGADQTYSDSLQVGHPFASYSLLSSELTHRVRPPAVAPCAPVLRPQAVRAHRFSPPLEQVLHHSWPFLCSTYFPL